LPLSSDKILKKDVERISCSLFVDKVWFLMIIFEGVLFLLFISFGMKEA